MMVLWLTGKSGAGKTEIGKQLHEKLKPLLPNLIFLDGDQLREVLGKDLDFTIQDRYTSEERASRLSKLLSDQNIHIIFARLSNAPDIREWNKRHVKDFREIYLKVDDTVLHERDSKGFYGKFKRGEMTNVVGADIPFHEPKDPWLVFENNGNWTPQAICNRILESIQKDFRHLFSYDKVDYHTTTGS